MPQVIIWGAHKGEIRTGVKKLNIVIKGHSSQGGTGGKPEICRARKGLKELGRKIHSCMGPSGQLKTCWVWKRGSKR